MQTTAKKLRMGVLPKVAFNLKSANEQVPSNGYFLRISAAYAFSKSRMLCFLLFLNKNDMSASGREGDGRTINNAGNVCSVCTLANRESSGYMNSE